MVIFVSMLVLLSVGGGSGAPVNATLDFEAHLNNFLDAYYERFLMRRETVDEEMQGDQPAADDDGAVTGNGSLYVEMRKGTGLEYAQDERWDKNNWMEVIKNNILRQLGRENTTRMPEQNNFPPFNMTGLIDRILNDTVVHEDQIAERLRSYYPSCDVPRNTDQDLWKDENSMNLYFNLDHVPEDVGASIATATLRLYRLPNGTDGYTNGRQECENSSTTEDERLMRISIYWYARPLKKHRGVKRRLCDSKVVGENSRWVELNVRPAIRAWSKGGRNLGLALLVEDQDGNVLKADRFFKGASCTQPQNLSQRSYVTQPNANKSLDELTSLLERIYQQPCILTYHCYQ